MKTYQKNGIQEFQAVQYGVGHEAKKLVSLCKKYDGKIYEVPSDLMGKPKDALKAVKNGDELIVVPNRLFKLFFEEKN